jgi:molybdenum cofactor cytidylyltransferase
VSEQPSIAAIILAAGCSSRMEQGQHKLLLPLGDKPVIAHVMEAVLASQARPQIVVLGYQALRVRNVLASYSINTSLILIENPDYEQGMSTSLRTGIATLQSMDRTQMIDSALILLGDQPFISAEIINTLITRRKESGQRIIVPTYQGKQGTPVLFAASLFPELTQVVGDKGGKSVINCHPTEIENVDISNSMAEHDVDTWEAYQQAIADWQDKAVD